MFEGKVAASNMLNGTTTIPDHRVPAAAFTIPEPVRVGLSEVDAKASDIDLDVRYTDTTGWYSNDRIGGNSAQSRF